MELNKQIMRICDTRDLCDFVSTHSAEFNHVNVDTSFRKILQFSQRLPGVLAQRTALTHLDLHCNEIGAAGTEGVRTS